MTVKIEKYKLFYVAVPKVACTSIKTALFKLQNGFDFQDFITNWRYIHIHHPSVYPSMPFVDLNKENLDGYFKVALVRDPVERFLSAYSNRVGHYRELSAERIGEAATAQGLRPDPDLHEFIEHLDAYRAVSPSILHHTDPMWVFLGEDPAFYDRIFNLRYIDAFAKTISEMTGTEFTIPRLQTQGEKISVDTLSPAEKRKIEDFYARDYDMFRTWL